MTLTNYWWLLVWLFTGGVFLRSMPRQHEQLNEITVERWKMLPAIVLVVPYVIWAGFRSNFVDTGSYRQMFWDLSTDFSQIGSLFSGETKDPGYTVLMMLIKTIIGNKETVFFLIIATIQMLCMAMVFRRYSADYWTCIFLFVASTDYMSWMQNGMRQFLACCIIFACYKWLVNKRFIPLIFVILLVSSIHGSALLMIPVIFIVQGKAWNIKSILVLLLSIIVIRYIDRFTPILNDLLQETQYDDVMSNGIWDLDDGTNIIRVAVYSVPAIFSLFALKYIRAANDPAINISVNCSVVTMALYLVAAESSGIYIGRLPIYTTLQGYIALPWMIDRMFTKESARLVKFAMIGLYAVFFYYQMHFNWQLI